MIINTANRCNCCCPSISSIELHAGEGFALSWTSSTAAVIALDKSWSNYVYYNARTSAGGLLTPYEDHPIASYEVTAYDENYVPTGVRLILDPFEIDFNLISSVYGGANVVCESDALWSFAGGTFDGVAREGSLGVFDVIYAPGFFYPAEEESGGLWTRKTES